MPRNLVRRVELMTPILEPNLSQKIEQILMLQLADNQLRWTLQPSGEYIKVPQPSGKPDTKRRINNADQI